MKFIDNSHKFKSLTYFIQNISCAPTSHESYNRYLISAFLPNSSHMQYTSLFSVVVGLQSFHLPLLILVSLGEFSELNNYTVRTIINFFDETFFRCTNKTDYLSLLFHKTVTFKLQNSRYPSSGQNIKNER